MRRKFRKMNEGRGETEFSFTKINNYKTGEGKKSEWVSAFYYAWLTIVTHCYYQIAIFNCCIFSYSLRIISPSLSLSHSFFHFTTRFLFFFLSPSFWKIIIIIIFFYNNNWICIPGAVIRSKKNILWPLKWNGNRRLTQLLSAIEWLMQFASG